MAHVVIVGAGIAGVPAAYALRNRLHRQDKVTIVSDKDYFHFVPSNPWIAMGWRDRSDIAFPIQGPLNERGIRFIHSAVTRVDGANNKLQLANGNTVDYDYLILATGPEPNYEAIPGLSPKFGAVHSVVHLEEALQAHRAYQAFLEKPGPVVIGAVQNAAVLGPIYEFAFLVDADLRRRNLRERVPITLLTPEPYLGHLGLGTDPEIRALLERALAGCNISWLVQIKTKKIEMGQIHVAECDSEGKEIQNHVLPFAYAALWPAFRAATALRESPGICDEQGLVKVDTFLRNPTYSNVFALGLCAAHGAAATTALPLGAPNSVYAIQNEVDTTVRNIVALMRGEETVSPAPLRAKWLTDMGKQGAAFLTEPQIPFRNINWLKDGRWVHIAKTDFESYFINKIKLRPAGNSDRASSHLATLLRKLQTSASSEVNTLQYGRRRLPRCGVAERKNMQYELQALAKVLGQEHVALTDALLEAALNDAKTLLDGATSDDLQKAKHDLMLADLPEHQPGVDFHAGGT